tara:strand:+ start:1733 stop:2779 length:1047 start_codon:yes stop_codon:yes gene_type:complete
MSNKSMFFGFLIAVLVNSLIFSVPLFAQDDEESAPAVLEEWEREELLSLLNLVNEAQEGEQAPHDNPFMLTPTFVKGTDGNTHIPFTLTIDPEKIGESVVAVYMQVQDLSSPTEESDDDDGEGDPAFEDAFFLEVSKDGGSVYLSRAFYVPGGEYEVLIGLRDSKGPDAEEEELEAVVPLLFREKVSVPNLWNDELQTSSVIVTAVVEPQNGMLSREEQLLYPYSQGNLRIEPKHDLNFGKTEELSFMMLVYNPEASDGGVPDVTVQYNFHQITDAGEEFFNKTNPQEFNKDTLPPGFSLEAGHQVVAGYSLPLNLFPPADYRLEISITDNEGDSEVSQNLNFTVGEE